MKHLKNGQIGVADLFIQYYKDDYIITDTKSKSGYIYNKKTALWNDCDKSTFIYDISTKVRKLLQKTYSKLKNISKNEDDYDKNKRIIDKIFSQNNTTYFTKGVFSYASVKLENKKFMEKLNSSPYLLPIKIIMLLI